MSEPGERLATRYLPGLTGLRGVGAIWVMVFHIQYGRDIPILDSGFLGVDLFFILSGFVLSHTYGAMRFRGTEYALFIRDRVARIFPLHWAALAILGVVLLIFPEIYHSMAARFRSPELIANILLVQNWGFTRPGTWNIPAWSLSTEWLVSLAFPLFLLGARRFTRPVACVLGCAVCLGLLAAFLHATGNPNPNVQSRAAVIRTVLEFATGCLLYRLYIAGVRVPIGAKVVAIILFAVGLSAPDRAMFVIFALPIAILLSTEPSVLRSVLASGTLAFLGKISFSIYLLHWIILQVSDRLQARLGVHGVGSILWSCGYVVLVIAASALTYGTVENPARVWIKGWRLPRPPRVGRSKKSAFTRIRELDR